MEPQFAVRRAAVGDVHVLAEFNLEMAAETEERQLDRDTLVKGVTALLENPDAGFYLVAEHQNMVIGALMVTSEWSDWRNGRFWWIQSVFVHKEYRRRGAFRTLFQRVDELASLEPDVCGLRLYVERENGPAHATYEAMGMHKTHYEMYELEFSLSPDPHPPGQ